MGFKMKGFGGFGDSTAKQKAKIEKILPLNGKTVSW